MLDKQGQLVRNAMSDRGYHAAASSFPSRWARYNAYTRRFIANKWGI